MLRYIQRIGEVGLCAALLHFARPASAEEVQITIIPATTTIRVNDPLFLKVIYENRSDKDIALKYYLGSGPSSVLFELRRPGRDQFEKVSAVESGTADGMWGPGRRLVPRVPLASMEALLRSSSGRKWMFAEPGEYELRARLSQHNDATGVSAPFRIRVERGVSDEHDSDEVRSLFFEGIRTNVFRDRDNFVAVARKAQDSKWKETFEWLAAIAAVRDAGKAGDEKELREAQEAVAKLVKAADPVTRDWITLILARQYRSMKKWDLATAEFKKIAPPTPEILTALPGIVEDKRLEAEAKDPNRVPPKRPRRPKP